MGSAEFGGSSSASGPSTSFTANFKFDAPKLPSMPGTLMLMNLNQLQNLVNEIDVANIQSAANFNGNGAGSNHVKTLNGQAGSVLNVSQLQNLADSHMGNFDSFGDVAFVGGGDGMHTIDNMRANAGSTTTFSQLQNLVNKIDVANIQSTANFNGNGAGSNHIGTLNGQAGSVLNFSQLQNLADSHMGNFDSFGDVAFVGGGDGMHTIDNMRGNVGSTTTFSI